MRGTVTCAEHGDRDWAAVCAHILETLQDEVPRGFWWVIDDEGGYQAFCTECEHMDGAEWERVREDMCTILCIECFLRAASINNVALTLQ